MTHRFFRKHVAQPMSFFSDIITKFLKTIFASKKFQWILNFSVGPRRGPRPGGPISEFAVNTPTRGGVLGNLRGVRFAGIWIGALNWFEDRFKICVHNEWDFQLILPIVKCYCRSLSSISTLTVSLSSQ